VILKLLASSIFGKRNPLNKSTRNFMSETFYVVPVQQHNSLVESAYRFRKFNEEESKAAAKFSAFASWHGIRTHNALKAIHLDHLFGSSAGGCVPDAEIEKKDSRFAASQIWNANKKLGQATAYAAMEEATDLADKYGIGQVSVDNAFHYLWGGGYVMEAAQKGYIAYTNCTAALAEVVPFGGKTPTLGTNPHSWGFPTTDAVGFPLVIDWATSVIAMGRVQQFQREGTALPPNAAVDASGNMTTDANEVAALTTFGAHKGYGLSVINEIVGAFIGGSLPTLRSRWGKAENEKHTPAFYFQVIHPDAMSGGDFAQGRTQSENVKAVLDDIIGPGNEKCLLPGQIEAQSAARSKKNDGLLFSEAEIAAFNEIATECGEATWDIGSFKTAE
jgi:L-2-hydroxycarboxylate dehydrogenase (NAD+)